VTSRVSLTRAVRAELSVFVRYRRDLESDHGSIFEPQLACSEFYEYKARDSDRIVTRQFHLFSHVPVYFGSSIQLDAVRPVRVGYCAGGGIAGTFIFGGLDLLHLSLDSRQDETPL
jgi:hypothetical protein